MQSPGFSMDPFGKWVGDKKNFFSGAKAYHLVGCELQCPEMRSMDDAWPLAQKHAFSPRKGGIWTLSQYPLSPSEVPV